MRDEMKALWGIMGGLLWGNFAGAQEPQYATWDRLFVKPELPLRAVVERGEVTLLLYHTYPSTLHHLRLSGGGAAFEVTADPPELAELEPTLIVPVKLHLRRRGPMSGDTLTVPVEFAADEMSRRQTLDLTVPLTPQGEATGNEALSVPVGQVDVVVTKMGRVTYALQIGAVLLLLAWLVGRRRKLGG